MSLVARRVLGPRRRFVMSGFGLALALALLLSGQPWPVRVEAAETAPLDPRFSLGWPSVSANQVSPGATVGLAINAQARVPAVLTFVASAVAPDASATTIARQAGLKFTAWQTQRFQASWNVPTRQAVAGLTLRFQLFDDSGVEVARRETRLALASIGSSGPTPTPTTPPTTATPTTTATSPAPTATPTIAPSPTATPTRPATGSDVTIIGSAAFVARVNTALALIKSGSPADYAMIVAEVQTIQELSSGYSWANPTARTIGISGAAVLGSYGASLLVHEATHIQGFWGGRSWRGCDGEAVSLTAQARFLDRIRQSGLAAYVRGLIGIWC